MNQYIFPLCIQLAVPDSLGQPEFLEVLELLEKNGFYGVELNLTDLEQNSPEDIEKLLASYHLKMTMFATGAYAKKKGLSLSSENEEIRNRTVEELIRLTKFAAEAGAGVICGFMKGPAGDGRKASRLLKKSLSELDKAVLELEAPLLLEATNHYEAAAANTVGETVGLIEPFRNPYFQVLPDTYHMNIEERDWAMALCRYGNDYHSVHISDNNRRFPGEGAIDFYHVFAVLAGLGYDGLVAVEGNAGGGQKELKDSILRTSAYLKAVSERLMSGWERRRA